MGLSVIIAGYVFWTCVAVTGLVLTLLLIPEFVKTII